MKETKSNLKKNLVSVYSTEKRIIFYHESKTTSPEQLDFNFRSIRKMADPFKSFFLILDLTEAKRPSAETRQHILEKFDHIRHKLSHIAIVTGKNFIINMAATFILKKTKFKSYSIHKTLAEAEKAIDKKNG